MEKTNLFGYLVELDVEATQTGMLRQMPGAAAAVTAGSFWNMLREIHFRVLYQRQ